jgi:hypothetical protein
VTHKAHGQSLKSLVVEIPQEDFSTIPNKVAHPEAGTDFSGMGRICSGIHTEGDDIL